MYLYQFFFQISIGHLKFENDILSTGLGIVGETLGLAISLIAKKKNLPLILLQICISVTYFCMMSIDPGEIQTNEIIGILSKGTYIVPHSSEIRGLCLMKCSIEMLQNLVYFLECENSSSFFHFVLLYYFP